MALYIRGFSAFFKFSVSEKRDFFYKKGIIT